MIIACVNPTIRGGTAFPMRISAGESSVTSNLCFIIVVCSQIRYFRLFLDVKKGSAQATRNLEISTGREDRIQIHVPCITLDFELLSNILLFHSITAIFSILI